MKTLRSILKWSGLLLILLISVLLAILHFIDLSTDPEDIELAFANRSYQPEYKTVSSGSDLINYVTLGDSTHPAVLFIHGSPGSWDNFLALMTDSTLLESFRMIAYDRPGFGSNSELGPLRTLSQQATIAASVLKAENTSALLAGHSYGGPVAIKAGIEYPELTNGLILIAGSVDPELEDMYWFQYPFSYGILSWLLPDYLYSSNEEILALESELRAMEKEWGQISVPVSIIQGGKDQLVPKENASFAMQKLTNTSAMLIYYNSMDHFIPWRNPEIIRKELFRIRDEIWTEKNTTQ